MEANVLMLLLLKATLLLGLAFAAVRWERTSPAARRHGVWSVTFVALLALPVLALSLPGIHIPLPAWFDDNATIQRPADPLGLTRSRGEREDEKELAVSPQASRLRVRQNDVGLSAGLNVGSSIDADGTRVNVVQAFFVLWLVGVAAALFALMRSLLRVRRLVAAGRCLDDAQWIRAAERIARRLGLDAMPQLIVSDSVSAPMAGNIGQPIVFLPADAAQWDADRRDVVLTHELTHLARRDPLRILAARVACALYWFHPLIWLAARRSTADCEQACDESVLAHGIRPSIYARVLLDFANQVPSPVPSVTLPIVRRHRLENRVMAILSNPGAAPRRTASPGRTFLTALGSMALIVSVAAARPSAVEAVNIATDSGPAATETAAQENASAETVPTTVAKTTVDEPKAMVPSTSTDDPAASTASSVATQAGSCWNAYDRARSFSGSSTTTYGNRLVQRIGRIGNERVAQMTFGELRVCMITFGYDGSSDLTEPSEWIGRADRVVMETDRENDVRRLEIEGGRTTWTVNGRSVPIDDGVGAWRRAFLDLLDTGWEVSTLRGRESSLRGEISSIQGERSSLLGEISSLRGEVSSMQGEISSLRGQESSLRGEISSIRGHESSLRGQISSERGAISSLESQRWERSADREAIAARIRRHEDNIRDIEREISRYDADARVRAVEREIAAHETEHRVADVERRIRDFDVERKVADVERRIADLNVERQVRGIEGEIRDLDVDTRSRDLSAQREAALDRLRAILGMR